MNDIPCFEYQMCNTSTREKAWRLVYVTFSKGVKKRDLEIFKTASIHRARFDCSEKLCVRRDAVPLKLEKKKKKNLFGNDRAWFFSLM